MEFMLFNDILGFFFSKCHSIRQGESRKSYVILMGGQAKCLILMTRGEGGSKKPQKPAYVIHGCSLNQTSFLVATLFCRFLQQTGSKDA